jgi:hypothetical protein
MTLSDRRPNPGMQSSRLAAVTGIEAVQVERQRGPETTPAPVNVLFERARRTSPSVRAFLDYLIESTQTGPLAGMSRVGD